MVSYGPRSIGPDSGTKRPCPTQRGGIPLLNQSPFIEKPQVEAAYGQRWQQFSAWVKTCDPGGRMLNPFFAALL